MEEKVEVAKYTRDNIFKAVRKMMPPIAVQSILAAIVSATDALMLGVLNQDSLTAVTLASQLMQIYTFFILALGVGTTALSAQYWGKGDSNTVGRILHIALQFSLSAGLIFMFLCMVTPEVAMSFYTSDPVLIEMGSTYLRYLGLTYFFMGFTQIYMIIMKNTGRILSSSVFGTITVILNVVLDAILIFGLFGLPQMGIAGAALATSISRGVEFVLTLVVSRMKNSVEFSIKKLFKRYKNLKKKYLRYTLPSIFQMTSWMVATSAGVAIMGHLDSDAVAASAVEIIVVNIAVSIVTAYGSSVSIIIGQQLGCGDIEESKVCADKLLKGSVVIGAIVGTIVCVLAPIIPRFATTLTDAAKGYLFWMIIIGGAKIIGKSVNHTFANGIFSAGGDIKFLLKLDIINMWFVILPLGAIAAFLLKLPPIFVFLIVNLDEYTKMFTEYKHYKEYRWAKNLTKKEWAEPGKYEKELRETIVNRMPMGAIVLGSSGKISMSNPAAEEILGISEDDLQGESLAIFTLSDERNLPFNQCILDAVYDKSTVSDAVIDFYTKEECKRIQVNTSFIEEEDANIGVLILIYDVGRLPAST